VVHQQTGERNFHSFYYLLNGIDEKKLSSYNLKRNCSNYIYVNQDSNNNDGQNDKQNYDAVMKSMKIVGFDDKIIDTIWNIVASIIHLGNVKFEDTDTHDKCAISRESIANEIKTIAKLLNINENELNSALTTRVIATGAKDVVTANHTMKDASYAKDAFAKVCLSEELVDFEISFFF
jgi:myosin-1